MKNSLTFGSFLFTYNNINTALLKLLCDILVCHRTIGCC